MNLPWTFLLALTLLAGSMPCGYGSSVHPNSAQNGFVPLSQWADENDFKLIWSQNDEFVMLAYQLQKSLVKNLSAEDRGVRRARFAVLRTAEMPAVLIEGGFLTDAVEQKKIADPKYRDQLASAIVQGVLAYQHAAKS